MKKRLIGTIGVVAASAAVLTGCGAEEAAESSGDGTFSYMMPDRQMAWLNDQKVLPVIAEETGVTTELVDGGPQGEYYQRIDLDIASKGVGDAAIVSLAQMQVYGPQGAFVDLAPLIAEHAPNIQRYIDEHPEFASIVTQDDGAIYGLILERPRIGPVTMYRADMFRKAGITEAPKNIAELTEAMRTLKDAYGEDSGYYPMTGRDYFMNLLYAFGATFSVDDDGTTHGVYDASPAMSLDVKSEGFLEAITWYKAVYEEGLIDPIWVEGSMSEEDWQALILNGDSSITTDFFTRPAWFMANGGPEIDPDFSVEVMMPFEDEAGNPLSPTSNATFDASRVFVIDQSSDEAVNIIKMLDYLYSEEGQTTLHYGVEGETYDIVDGEPQYLVRYDDVADSPVGTPVWAFHQDRISYPAPVDNAAYYAFLDDFTGSYASEYFEERATPHPVIRYTPEQQEEKSAIYAGLQTAMTAGFGEFVRGDRELSEWDDFLAELDALGYEDMVALDAEAFAAQQG